jgi:hypothetical protein
MAKKVQINEATRLEKINIHIPNCPGCHHEHDLTPRRPSGQQVCGRGFGSYLIDLVNRSGYIEVNVIFLDTHYNQQEIRPAPEITVRE